MDGSKSHYIPSSKISTSSQPCELDDELLTDSPGDKRNFGSEVPDTDAESEGRFGFEIPDTDAMTDDGYEDEDRDEEGNGARLDVEMDEVNTNPPG